MRLSFLGFTVAACAACSTPAAPSESSLLGDIPGADANALAGNYEGVLIRGTGSGGNVSLEGSITVTADNPVQITLTSTAFAPISATVLSFGDRSVNLNWVNGTAADSRVQLVDFYKDGTGNWLLVLETGQGGDAGELAIDFASYDPAVTKPAANAEALAYFNDALEAAQAAGGQ